MVLAWLISADLQGGSSRADRRAEEVRPAGETEDSSTAVVQPREEGLYEASPRGTHTHTHTLAHTQSVDCLYGLSHYCLVSQVSQKELKEALRRQWSQLSDKRRLKWISKALELQKDYEVPEPDSDSPLSGLSVTTITLWLYCVCVCVCVCVQGSMRAYHEAHPDVNSDDHVRSVLTKAERQLKDKFDGRPTKPPPWVLTGTQLTRTWQREWVKSNILTKWILYTY